MNGIGVRAAAEIAGVSAPTMRRWAADGTHGLVAHKIGRDWIIDPASLGDTSGRVIQRARALLMEYHGTMGCDPSCEARYHEIFPPLTQEEFELEVGDLRGTWPDGTPG